MGNQKSRWVESIPIWHGGLGMLRVSLSAQVSTDKTGKILIVIFVKKDSKAKEIIIYEVNAAGKNVKKRDKVLYQQYLTHTDLGYMFFEYTLPEIIEPVQAKAIQIAKSRELKQGDQTKIDQETNLYTDLFLQKVSAYRDNEARETDNNIAEKDVVLVDEVEEAPIRPAVETFES